MQLIQHAIFQKGIREIIPILQHNPCQQFAIA